MASSGSFSGSIKDGHYIVRVDWSQAQDVANNKSTITAKVYLINDWSLSINGRTNNTITIDGTKQTFSSPSISSKGTHLLGTLTQAVNHAGDGSKSLSGLNSKSLRHQYERRNLGKRGNNHHQQSIQFVHAYHHL